MKKTLIALGVIILVAAALPIIGNSVMQSSIETRVSELKTYGLESQNVESHSGYLSTKKHFEFLLKDADAFVEYLNQYADQQIPPYVNAMLEGVLVGVDLEYSNIPFSKSIELDIYPISMSQNMAEGIKREDRKFYEYLENFLHSKGVLYHINYNIMSEDFDGFVKNIDEKHTLKDMTQLELLLKDTVFEGNGELMAPNRMTTSIKEIELKVKKAGENILFDLEDLHTATSYESKSTYLSSAELKDFNFVVNGTSDDVKFELKNIKINASSNTLDEFAELDTRASIEALNLDSQELNLDMSNFNMDMAVDSLDKVSFEETLELISKMKNLNDAAIEERLQESLGKLLSKGFVFSIADFSVEDILLEESEELKGFKIHNKTTLKPDADFMQKLQVSPLLLVSNVDIETKIRVSRQIYAKLTKERPLPQGFSEYVKEDGDDYIFDIVYKNASFSVNGKVLR